MKIQLADVTANVATFGRVPCSCAFLGEFRPVDNNETVNEVVSNWGAAQAMAAARGDDKYFDAPKPQRFVF